MMGPNQNVPLCGDETCESPGCRQEAIDAWNERMVYEAKRLVRPWAVTPEEEERWR